MKDENDGISVEALKASTALIREEAWRHTW